MTLTPQKISWDLFKAKNENYTKSFEELCYHIFCRKYASAQGLRIDYNQKGLETYPVKKGKELIGFQAKFFENKLSDISSVRQINHSIKNAKSAFPTLSKIIIYTHQSFGSKEPAYKKSIELTAKPLKIEWVMDSHFQSLLFNPQFIDLAYLYFGAGNEIGFIKNNSNPSILTLLQSAECISLPLIDKNDQPVTEVKKSISTSLSKEFMISGNPGSGKSILLQKLFQEFGGLDQKNDAAMLRQITKQGAVPMLINLKNCHTDSLESLLRQRQQDNNIQGKIVKFIYLFDGLDELNEATANKVLHYISELVLKNDTHKIILSCRTGSLNRTRAKVYLKDITDFKITSLTSSHIDLYFKGKKDIERAKKLKAFRKENSTILTDVKDILLAHIFWEVIDGLPLSANVTDLLQQKILLLLHNPNHHKNIDELNLLNPKINQIITINQDISFFFIKSFNLGFQKVNFKI